MVFLIYRKSKLILTSQKGEANNIENSPKITRKGFLTGVGGLILDSVPFFATGTVFTGMYYSSIEFQVFKREIKISDLHKSFVGFRIVQISDIHIGSLINESYLKPTLEIIQSLKPNCIFVTGDILDNSIQYLNILGWYFAKLNEICSVYAILGNHDHIDNSQKLIKTLKETKTKVLVNEYAVIQKEKGYINLIGLDYPMFHFTKRREISQYWFRNIYKKIKYKEYPIIVLNHHPSEFEYLKNEKVDLVLSGHTHGGQIIFSKDRNSPFALGSNFLKYYIDYYKENNVQLYVNRGLGHWFPLRINCPAEITLFELV
ncbi:MAG: metallophosphoesterase [Leptonema sp. (in: bacteria)]